MAKIQQSLPFVYGYKGLLNGIVKELKAITDKQLDKVLEVVLDYPVYTANIDSELKYRDIFEAHNQHCVCCGSDRSSVERKFQSERDKLKEEIALAMFVALEGWSDEINAELFSSFINSRSSSYGVGSNDARLKLQRALRKYDGKNKDKVSAIISALRKEEFAIPVSHRVQIPSMSVEDLDFYSTSFQKKIALIVAGVVVLKRIKRNQKKKVIEQRITDFFRKNTVAVSKGKDITSFEISMGLRDYYFDHKIPAHQCIVDNPQDTTCYSNDTELLTTDGWVNINTKNLHLKSFITLDKEGFVRESRVKKVIRKEYDGVMHNLVSKNTDLLVTPDHNLCYISENKQRQRSYSYEFRKASGKLAKRFAMPKASMHKVIGDKYVKYLGKEIRAELYASLLGWYLSEGSVLNDGYGIRISQDKNKNPSKWNEIKNICDEIRALYGFNTAYDNCGAIIYGKQIADDFKWFGKSFQKFIPPILFVLDGVALESFLRAYIDGDGHVKHYSARVGGLPRTQLSIVTSSYKMVGGLSRVFLLLGYGVSVSVRPGCMQKFKNGTYRTRDCYEVRLVQGKYSNVSRVDKLKYKDEVWCVELRKDHTLYTKRNGKCVWSGNCIMVANEIVPLGVPFSNGFLHPLFHRWCHCTTIPVRLTDEYISYLVNRYNL